MGTITKKQFLKDVMHEIDMLKLHATDEEKGNLDFYYFDATDVTSCIYGQLTGNCKSDRAKELMDIACIRQWHTPSQDTNLKKPFTDIKKYINGAYNPNSGRWTIEGIKRFSYLSALEGYIQTGFAKNLEIISYIKGGTNTLSL